MASRKDNKGRVLRKGEVYNENRGMYVYTYYDVYHVRRFTYAKDLLLLREKEKSIIKNQMEYIDSYTASNSDLNFWFDRYISSCNHLRKRTRSHYEHMYDMYVRNELGKKRIAEIKYSDVLLFYQHLVIDKSLSGGTVHGIQTFLKPTFQMAVRDNVIRANPTDGAMKNLKKKTEVAKSTVRHALSMTQQRCFLEYVATVPEYERWKPFFTVLLGTGCRIGELVGLRWDDIDLESRMIDINHALVYFAGKWNKDKEKWVINEPKTEAGIRIIPMVDQVYEAFIEEKNKQELYGISCKSVIGNMSNFIFFNKNYNLHRPDNVNRQIKRIVERYNGEEREKALLEGREPCLLPVFSCHYLRHTFCSRLCEANVNVKVIQMVMGHKDINTTLDIYAEVNKKFSQMALDEIQRQNKLF